MSSLKVSIEDYPGFIKPESISPVEFGGILL